MCVTLQICSVHGIVGLWAFHILLMLGKKCAHPAIKRPMVNLEKYQLTNSLFIFFFRPITPTPSSGAIQQQQRRVQADQRKFRGNQRLTAYGGHCYTILEIIIFNWNNSSLLSVEFEPWLKPWIPPKSFGISFCGVTDERILRAF